MSTPIKRSANLRHLLSGQLLVQLLRLTRVTAEHLENWL